MIEEGSEKQRAATSSIVVSRRRRPESRNDDVCKGFFSFFFPFHDVNKIPERKTIRVFICSTIK